MYGWAFTYENSTARVLFDLSVRFAVHQLRIYNLAVFLYDDMQMIAQLLVVNIASGLCNGILLIDLIALFHSDIGQALIGYAQILLVIVTLLPKILSSFTSLTSPLKLARTSKASLLKE